MLRTSGSIATAFAVLAALASCTGIDGEEPTGEAEQAIVNFGSGSSGFGSGSGSGSGSSGFGSGSGSAFVPPPDAGVGSGSGSGSAFVPPPDAGMGSGSGSGYDAGYGSGYGSDDGSGYGSGYGSGSGSGDYDPGSDLPGDDDGSGSDGYGSGSGSGSGGEYPPPSPGCFGDLLSVAEERIAELRSRVLPRCTSFRVTEQAVSPSSAPYIEPPDGEEEGSTESSTSSPRIPRTESGAVLEPQNCGYSDAQVAAHRGAVDALTDFQAWFRAYLETPSAIYAVQSNTVHLSMSLLSCLNALQNTQFVAAPPAAPPPPAPVCNPPNQEYNCKAVVEGHTRSYWNGNSAFPYVSDSTRGTTCTDTLWREPFYWERMLYAPWSRSTPERLARKGQILVRASAGSSRGGLWSWETHTSCHRETESVKTKFRLVLEPRATIVPRWVWDPRNGGAWRPNNENWARFRDANDQRCSSDCLQAGEGERQFKIGASVRPKLTAQFGGLVVSNQVPDGYWDWGNNTNNYLSQVLGTMHCFGPGTLYTAQDTFTTLPSDVPMPFDAQIAKDCTISTNTSVNGSVSYTQGGGNPASFTLGVGGQAGQQTACKRSEGSDIRMALSCNMAEGAGFANFRSASIDMPAHSDNCKNNGACAWQSMSVGGQHPATKLDLGYWFEQLAAIGRASPADGNGWAHSRRGYAHFRRGGWQFDVNSPDWAGSWANHRHAWEGAGCKLYKISNPTTGALEAMGDDKAICVFAGQAVTDPHANPGVPTATNPEVMLWPYDNAGAAWDPELGRPSRAECTQNAQCLSGTCQGGACQ